jgi:hypothetical protein
MFIRFIRSNALQFPFAMVAYPVLKDSGVVYMLSNSLARLPRG